MSYEEEIEEEFQKTKVLSFILRREITGILIIDRDSKRYGYCKKCKGLINTHDDTFCYLCNSLMEFIFCENSIMEEILDKRKIERFYL